MGKLLGFFTKTSIYLLVFLVPLAFSPWTLENFEFPKQYILFFLALVGFVAWLAKMVLIAKEVNIVRTPLDKAIFLFAAVLLVSTVFSEDRISSLLGQYGRFSDGSMGMAGLVLFYILLVNHVGTHASGGTGKIPVSRLLNTFVFSITIVVVLWYVSFLGVAGMRQGLNLGGGSQEGLAVFLAALLPFFISRLSPNGLLRVSGLWFLLFVLASFVVLLAIDFSRAWIIFILGLLLLLFLRVWQRVRTHEKVSARRVVPILVFAFIAFVSLFKPVEFSLPFPEVPKETVLAQNVSWGVVTKNAKENVKNTFLGSGPATFGVSFSEHKPVFFNETPEWRMRFDRAGSHIAEALSTLGLLGVVAWLALAGLFLTISAISILYLVDRKEKRNPVYEEVNGAFLVLVFGLFVSQFFYYHNTLLAFSFWFALALGVISFEQGMKELNISLKRYLEIALVARVLLLVLLVGAALSFFIGAKLYLADVRYKKAVGLVSSPVPTSKQIDLMAQALSLNPWQGEYKLYLSRLFFTRAKEALLLGAEQQDKAMISLDVQKAIAYARGDVIEGKRIQGAIQVAPKSVGAWETLGSLYQEIGFAPGAAEWGVRAYEEAIQLEPTNPVLYNELAKVYTVKEDFDKAREQVEKALALKPDFLQAQRQRALLYEKQGDTAAAKKLLESLTSQYATDVDLLFQLGKLYYNTKEAQKAILQFEEATRLAPSHSNAHYALGVAYEAVGKTREAIAQFERVLELNPANEEVAKQLEQLR